uniref:Methyltransferase-like protein 6 n=1 Tax=Rhizophora mucronata TaxID=61149 RepID=A0A2P2JT42_RHIMU
MVICFRFFFFSAHFLSFPAVAVMAWRLRFVGGCFWWWWT